MFEFLISKLKAHPRKIVFTEGTDPRILEASARLLSGTFLTPVLVGKEEEVRAAAEDAGFNIRGAIIVDPETYENMDAMVAKMVELRKGKIAALPIENLSMARETRIVYNRDFDHPEILQEITKTYQEVAKAYR